MSEIQIVAPRISTNDNYVTIGEWLVQSGSKVSKDDEIASLETTKKTESLLAPEDGYVFYEIEEGEDVNVGDLLCVLTDNASFEFVKEENPIDDYNITNKAKELILKHGIDLSKFSKTDIIREKDVLALLDDGLKVERSKANDILIVGGGGLAKMFIDLIRLNKSYNIAGIIDMPDKIGQEILGVKVIGTDDDLPKFRQEGYMTAINAVGSIGVDPKSKGFNLRKDISKKIKDAGFFMPTLIHPSAQVAPSAQLGEGVIVMENAVVGPDAVVGDDALINTGVIVSHDCVIGNHSRISPGAVLAGDVKVGENALVGMGTTIYIGVTIGRNAVISNGKNIFGNVAEYEVVQ